MKRLVSFGVIALLTTSAMAAPQYLTPNSQGGYDVTYQYTDKAKSAWYLGGRLDLNLMNWKYTFDEEGYEPVDDNVFKPFVGGDLFVGRKFNYFWRAELEGGYLGRYESDDTGLKHTLDLPYLMINGYRDFANGLYVGAGIGAAMPIGTASGLASNKVMPESTHYSAAFMGGVMIGFTHKLDDNLVLDLRYRLAGLTGMKYTVDVYDGDEKTDKAHDYTFDTGFILDNSISIGLRYEF